MVVNVLQVYFIKLKNKLLNNILKIFIMCEYLNVVRFTDENISKFSNSI